MVFVYVRLSVDQIHNRTKNPISNSVRFGFDTFDSVINSVWFSQFGSVSVFHSCRYYPNCTPLFIYFFWEAIYFQQTKPLYNQWLKVWTQRNIQRIHFWTPLVIISSECNWILHHFPILVSCQGRIANCVLSSLNIFGALFLVFA